MYRSGGAPHYLRTCPLIDSAVSSIRRRGAHLRGSEGAMVVVVHGMRCACRLVFLGNYGIGQTRQLPSVVSPMGKGIPMN